jgi:hypothetical protein
MTEIISLLLYYQRIYSKNRVYFERIIEKEMRQPLDYIVENNDIKLFHKITGSEKGIYIPSNDFIELANAFIEYEKPNITVQTATEVKTVFDKYGVKIKI